MRGLGKFLTGIASSLAEAWEELRIHKGRVLLSLVGVAVAVCALTTVVGAGAMAEQLSREVSERQSGRPASITFSAYMQSPTGQIDAAAVDAAWTESLARHEVAFASRVTWASANVQYADGVSPANLQLIDVPYGEMHRVQIVDGAWFTDRDARRLAPAVIVNEVVWDRLGRPPMATHPTLELADSGVSAVIIGVSRAMSEYDGESAYVLNDAFPALGVVVDPMMMSSPSYEMWVPEEHADGLMQAISEEVRAALGEGSGFDGWRGDYGAWPEDPFLATKLVVAGVAVVILVLGALSLVNITLVTVRTRIREIGIRRTFGATGGRVFFAVMLESVVGTFVAGIVGVGVSIALVRSPLPAMLIGSSPDDMPGFPVEAAVVGILAATVVGALAGLLPALTAVRVKVIDAIRF
ncbi:ABC transporter permease [Agromyces sp. SYSU K20354]|uniref:ABC transporter permease n=1 Tax=Agromyces cavernae TaxID=2898659 RepID=UPI001E2CDC96|nr:ABC transporter permease [Agromyces cavernae]MCD2443766.1 ABC transporter permease [Agromyces cavernae]